METPVTLSTHHPLSVERIRAVLASLPPLPEDDGLLRDYHRIVEIHTLASGDGLEAARHAARAALQEELPELEVDALPGGVGLAARRLDGVREEMRAAAEDALLRLDAIGPDEEAAVAACRVEIEAALAALR